MLPIQQTHISENLQMPSGPFQRCSSGLFLRANICRVLASSHWAAPRNCAGIGSLTMHTNICPHKQRIYSRRSTRLSVADPSTTHSVGILKDFLSLSHVPIALKCYLHEIVRRITCHSFSLNPHTQRWSAVNEPNRKITGHATHHFIVL